MKTLHLREGPHVWLSQLWSPALKSATSIVVPAMGISVMTTFQQIPVRSPGEGAPFANLHPHG